MAEELTANTDQTDVSNNSAESQEEIATENGKKVNIAVLDGSEDELTQMVIELGFQNDYLKSHICGMKEEHVVVEGTPNGSDGLNSLYEKIESLKKEIVEQKETQKAAENALEHLRVEYTDADSKVHELESKLIEEIYHLFLD